jgi:hypothetical protein
MNFGSHRFWVGTPRRRRPGASIGHVPDSADRKGREVPPRPPGFGAGTHSRRIFLAFAILIWLCLAHTASAQLDTFYLRNGTTLVGNVVSEEKGTKRGQSYNL